MWKAGRATGAAPTYFPPIRDYVDGGLQANNPTWEAIEEAQKLFPGRKIGCVVSLGCGAPADEDGVDNGWLARVSEWMANTAIAHVAGQIADTEQSHSDVLEKVWGRQAVSSGAELTTTSSEVYAEEHKFGDDTPSPSALHAKYLAPGALYARINPEVKLPELDCKDPSELAAFETATREFVKQDAVQAILRNVRLKLVEREADADAEAEPEPELEMEPEPAPGLHGGSLGSPPANEAPLPTGTRAAEASRATEAACAEKCPTFRACRQFVESFGLPEGTFDASSNICFCSKHGCAARHPDTQTRGRRPYGFPKGWCGLGLMISSEEFKRRRIWEDWDVAFHGTKKDTAVEVLKSDWQLLLPGDVTPSGYKIPIRPGHIGATFERANSFTGEREEFDPVQVFTSPSIHYCAYGRVYCDRTTFEGQQYQVAFQLRQEPGTYGIGQETVGAEGAGRTIDPLFPNSELEYYTKRKGVHKLYRLLVCEL